MYDLSKLCPCPKCGGRHIELYILIPRKGYTAVSLECKDCGHEVQSKSVPTLSTMKKHSDFIDRMEKAILLKWNRVAGLLAGMDAQ